MKQKLRFMDLNDFNIFRKGMENELILKMIIVEFFIFYEKYEFLIYVIVSLK